jgi:hypothetical protein
MGFQNISRRKSTIKQHASAADSFTLRRRISSLSSWVRDVFAVGSRKQFTTLNQFVPYSSFQDLEQEIFKPVERVGMATL